MLDPNCSNEKKGLPWLFEGILIRDELLPGLCRDYFISHEKIGFRHFQQPTYV